MDRSVCVVGLGLMGRPIAGRLLATGWAVRGWNRSPLSDDALRGIPRCPTLAEAAQCDVCVLLLADSDAVDEVLAQLEPHLAPGRLLIDMGTSDPTRTKAHARRLTARGVGWVDAPVSGGPEGAAKGSLAIMAGGSEPDVARAKLILEKLGRVVRVGDAGSGHTMKIVNQLIVGLTIEAVAEALILAEKSGLDPRLVQQALAGGFADSRILQVHGSRMIDRTYTPGGRARTQLKDLKLAEALARSASLRLPHLSSAVGLYQRLMDQGDGDLDHSAVHKLLTPAS